jgi:DNA-binding CsgD family transcriptional regulator
VRQGDYLQVSQSQSRGQFQAELVAFAHKMEFGLVSAAVVVDSPGERPIFEMVGNTPQPYQQTARDPEVGKRDPLLARMKRTGVPFTWDQSTYVKAGAADLWETQAQFGYKTGIAMALHMPGGRHFLLGVDRSEPLPIDDDKMMRLIADLQLLAVHTQETAVRVLLPERSGLLPVQKLTPRELEVLQWLSAGKSAWEVSVILNISVHTVRFYTRNLISKFGVSGQKAAVNRARSLGLI